MENEKDKVKEFLQKAAFLGLSEEGHEAAIALLDQVIKIYGGRKEIEFEALVAEAHISKGFMLGNWFFLIGPKEKSPKEAFAKFVLAQKTFDAVVSKFGNREESELAVKVANAFWYKGHVLEKAKQSKDAFLNYEQVVKRYGNRKEFELAKITVMALSDMGNILLESNNTEGALEIFENVIKNYGNRKEPDFANPLADAFYGKGVIFSKLNRHQEALNVYEELISKFSFSDNNFRVGPVAKALLSKGLSQCELGHFEAALKTFDEIIKKYGSGKFASIFEDLVTKANENKHAITLKTKGISKRVIPSIFDRIFGKKSDSALPPEMRDFYDEILGNKPVAGNLPCMICEGRRGPKDGYMCKDCTDFSKQTAGFSFARCGGCDVGFMVAHGLKPICFNPDGVVERVICACCMAHIKSFQPQASAPPIPPGYDPEGQLLNKSLAGQSLLRKLKSRANQARIMKTVTSEEKRKGLKVVEPVFKEELTDLSEIYKHVYKIDPKWARKVFKSTSQSIVPPGFPDTSKDGKKIYICSTWDNYWNEFNKLFVGAPSYIPIDAPSEAYWTDLEKNYPRTAEWLMNPLNMVLSQDDIENAKAMEGIFISRDKATKAIDKAFEDFNKIVDPVKKEYLVKMQSALKKRDFEESHRLEKKLSTIITKASETLDEELKRINPTFKGIDKEVGN